MDVLEELKTNVEAELQGASTRLKKYVEMLELLAQGAEADAKTHWVWYLALSVLCLLLGYCVGRP